MKKCVYRVTIDGQNVTDKIDPRLHRLTIADKEGTSSDTADIELDDTDGTLVLPKDGVGIEIAIGWEHEGEPQVLFRGTVDEPRSTGSRGSGTTLSISAKGIDTKSKVKEESQKHWDKKKLGEVLQDSAKKAGLSIKVDPELAKVERPYWSQFDESFLQFGQRLAEEVGGTFKIQGKKATLVKRGSGKNADGQSLPTIRAVYGENLIGWDIAPTLGRRRFNKVRVRFYDRKKGTWKEKTAEVRNEDTEVTKTVRAPAASEDEADTLGKADAGESSREKGGGTIRIDGNNKASPEGPVELVGARPGIDGTYKCTEVSHEVSRSGWETVLTVKEPGGDAGKDSRGKSSAK